MLELASRRGFREFAQPHVSAPGKPRDAEGAGILDFSGKECRTVEQVESPAQRRIGSQFLGVQGNRAWQKRRLPERCPSPLPRPRARRHTLGYKGDENGFGRRDLSDA